MFHYGAVINQAQDIIRADFRHLMKLAKYQALPWDPPPAELNRPSEALFFIKFRERARSTWNKSACLVAFRYMSRTRPQLVQAQGSETLWKKIVKHVDYLKRKWTMRYKTPQSAVKIYRFLRSVYSRKRLVSW